MTTDHGPRTTDYAAPDATGHFGPYGGTFVPEILIPELEALKHAFSDAWTDAAFSCLYVQRLFGFWYKPCLIGRPNLPLRRQGGLTFYKVRRYYKQVAPPGLRPAP